MTSLRNAEDCCPLTPLKLSLFCRSCHFPQPYLKNRNVQRSKIDLGRSSDNLKHKEYLKRPSLLSTSSFPCNRRTSLFANGVFVLIFELIFNMSLCKTFTLPCGVQLRNRIVKAAMTEGLADPKTHQPNRRHYQLYETWGRSGTVKHVLLCLWSFMFRVTRSVNIVSWN